MSNNYFKLGDYNVICDICSKKRKRSQCQYTWDGYLACTVEKCWYPKHPYDEPIRIPSDGLPVADARPRPTEFTFIDLGGIDTWDNQFTADIYDNAVTWDNANIRWDDDAIDNTLTPWNFD